jgi:hypothetical protein
MFGVEAAVVAGMTAGPVVQAEGQDLLLKHLP